MDVGRVENIDKGSLVCRLIGQGTSNAIIREGRCWRSRDETGEKSRLQVYISVNQLTENQHHRAEQLIHQTVENGVKALILHVCITLSFPCTPEGLFPFP